MKALVVATCLTVCLAGATMTQATCRQALAMGLDVSGSVDPDEYRLQLDGLAAALGDAEVMAALFVPSAAPVRIAIYEWSTPGDERIVQDWVEISDETALANVQTRLRSTQRALMRPSTGLGHALRVGFDLLEQQPECWKRTLDISGDGKANGGDRPEDVTGMPAGVTVNGLVIGSDDVTTGDARQVQIGELAAYYSTVVIRGPDAFVETALGFEDYADAMRRKLLRELAVVAVSEVGTTAAPAQPR